MGILKDYLARIKEKKARGQEVEDDYEVHHKLEQKHKNSNERELERYLEEKRQEHISKQLVRFRKQKNDSMWKTNLFKADKKHNLMKNRKFKLGGSILNGH